MPIASLFGLGRLTDWFDGARDDGHWALLDNCVCDWQGFGFILGAGGRIRLCALVLYRGQPRDPRIGC